MTIPSTEFALASPRQWCELKARANYLPRSLVIEMCVRLSLRVPGNIVEFGVASGDSTRVIRRTLRRYGQPWFVPYGRKKIFALDSFEGLREKFEGADAGTFKGAVPDIAGVRFVKGYFEDTCTEALRSEVGSVAFAHLDADLHSSTLVALRWLTPLLDTGSILLFDEFTGGDFAEQRAFDIWRKECGLELMRLAEFDRDPSGFGTIPDRRALYQVVDANTLPPSPDRSRLMWKAAYYLGRLGFAELKNRIECRF